MSKKLINPKYMVLNKDDMLFEHKTLSEIIKIKSRIFE